MFKFTSSLTIALFAVISPAFAQQHDVLNHHYGRQQVARSYHYGAGYASAQPVVVEYAPAYPGPVSQVDRWRFQQSIRQYHEAIAAQNRAETKRQQLEIARLKVERDALTESVVQHKADRLLSRRVTAETRANAAASDLWRSLQARSVSWPVAFDSVWALERLDVVVDAARARGSQSTTSAAAEIALDELEQAVRTQQLTSVRSERTDALKTLASLRRILKMDTEALVAMQ